MNQAQQSAPAPNNAGASVDLSLNEMLRVMDVARELRKDREVAEQALARDDVRAELRTKLMRTAELSGDRVTAAEIDVAIETYFANRHQYEDQQMSASVFAAHVWVRRWQIFGWSVFAAVASAAALYTFAQFM